ncbi:MAG: hypothetical protein GVY07_07360 [Bacteroidetes bacterium]|jgi:hypothetical protein|nr:hypothetical protein [Bacteroidota bacterium]
MMKKFIALTIHMLLYMNVHSQSIELNRVMEIGPDDLFGSFITDVHMGPDESVAVALNSLSQVHIYDLQGELINEYGRSGRGPGDFTNLRNVHVSESTIYAMNGGPGGNINAFERDNPENFRAFNLPRSGESSPVRMWFLREKKFLIEYRPGYSNNNLNKTIKSTYSIISIEDESKLDQVFQYQSNEMYTIRSNGGFSISDMPFGRQNFIIPLQNVIIHNWSDEKEFTKIDYGSANVIDVVEPQFSVERIPLNDQDYRQYSLKRLGISDSDNLSEIMQQLSSDPSSRVAMSTLKAKLENREELHSTFPIYRWLVGDTETICFGIPHEERSVTRVECTDLNGEQNRSGRIDSSVNILGLHDQYLYGTRALETGLTSVVVYEMR